MALPWFEVHEAGLPEHRADDEPPPGSELQWRAGPLAFGVFQEREEVDDTVRRILVEFETARSAMLQVIQVAPTGLNHMVAADNLAGNDRFSVGRDRWTPAEPFPVLRRLATVYTTLELVERQFELTAVHA